MNFRANLTAALSPKFDLSSTAASRRTTIASAAVRLVDHRALLHRHAELRLQGLPGRRRVRAVSTRSRPRPSTRRAAQRVLPVRAGRHHAALSPAGRPAHTGSFNANWRPFSWMQNDGTVGIDLADRDNSRALPPQRVPAAGHHSAGRGVATDNRQSPQLLGEGRRARRRGTRGRGSTSRRRSAPTTRTSRPTSSTRAAPMLPPGASTVGRGVDALRQSEQLAGRDEDARPLRPGSGGASRSAVPHRRAAHGPEQRVRHELPARATIRRRACRG